MLGFNIGSALSAVFAVPIADAAGSWRWSLVVFSAVTLALVPAWVWLTRDEEPHRRRPEAMRIRLPVQSGTAWVLVGIFGSMACLFYGLNSWLPDAYVEHGWSEGKAGALLAVLNIAALVTTVIIPWLVRPGRLAPGLPGLLQRRARRRASPGSPSCPAAPGSGP